MNMYHVAKDGQHQDSFSPMESEKYPCFFFCCEPQRDLDVCFAFPSTLTEC